MCAIEMSNIELCIFCLDVCNDGRKELESVMKGSRGDGEWEQQGITMKDR